MGEMRNITGVFYYLFDLFLTAFLDMSIFSSS